MRRFPAIVPILQTALLPAALLVAALLAVAGCEEEPTGSRTPSNNEISREWQGTYVGSGTYTDQAVSGALLEATITITDLGDNYVRVQLFLRPGQLGYHPLMRLEVPAQSLTTAGDQVTEDGITFFVGLRRANKVVNGAMWVRGQDNAVAWRIEIKDAVRSET